MTTEEINLLAEKCWEKVANDFKHRANGVNPHAYLLGFKDAMSKMDEYAKQECIKFIVYAIPDLFDNESAEWNYNRYIELKHK